MVKNFSGRGVSVQFLSIRLRIVPPFTSTASSIAAVRAFLPEITKFSGLSSSSPVKLAFKGTGVPRSVNLNSIEQERVLAPPVLVTRSEEVSSQMGCANLCNRNFGRSDFDDALCVRWLDVVALPIRAAPAK